MQSYYEPNMTEEEIKYWKEMINEAANMADTEQKPPSTFSFSPSLLIPSELDIATVSEVSFPHTSRRPIETSCQFPASNHLYVKNYTHFFQNGKPVPMDDVDKITKLEIGDKNFYKIGNETVILRSSLLNREYYINDVKLTRKAKMQMHYCLEDNCFYLNNEKVIGFVSGDNRNMQKKKKNLCMEIVNSNAEKTLQKKQKIAQSHYSIAGSSSPGMYPAPQANFKQPNDLSALADKEPTFLPELK